MRARILASFLDEEHRKWWTLGAVTFGLFMIMLDNTIVNVALPSIQRDLKIGRLRSSSGSSPATRSPSPSLMLTGGKLADRYGRRRIFIVGLAIFTASSLACGLAPNAGFLIGSRIVQGVGSAMMNPATLSIIVATFPPRQRGMAIGIWAGASAIALAIGPLIGGVITEHMQLELDLLHQRSGRRARDRRRPSGDQRDDGHLPRAAARPAGPASSPAAGLFALTYALIEANNLRLDVDPRSSLCSASPSLGPDRLPDPREHRQQLPMIDLSLFRNTTFAGANVVMLLVALAMFGVFFFISLYMQNVLGWTATQAGASFLPMTVLIVLVAPLAGRITDRVGSRWLVGDRNDARRRIAARCSHRSDATRTSGTCCPRCCSAGSGWRCR